MAMWVGWAPRQREKIFLLSRGIGEMCVPGPGDCCSRPTCLIVYYATLLGLLWEKDNSRGEGPCNFEGSTGLKRSCGTGRVQARDIQLGTSLSVISDPIRSI